MYDVTLVLSELGETIGIPLGLPLVFWTLVALPVYIVLDRWAHRHPAMVHTGVRNMLLSLPLGLGVALLLDFPSRVMVALPLPSPSAVPSPSVSGASPAEVALSFSWAAVSLGAAVILAALISLIALIRLVGQAHQLSAFTRTLPAETDPELAEVVADLQRRAGLARPVIAQFHDALAMPVTYGWRTPRILLPPSLRANSEAVRMALAHELGHIARHDYPWQVVIHSVRSVFAFHPLVHLFQRTLDYSRELACDALALESGDFSRQAYGRLLVSLTPTRPLAPLLAQPMLRSRNQLKNRLLAMKTRSQQPSRLGHLVPTFLLILCISAMSCSDVISQNPSTAVTQTATPSSDYVYVTVEDMPRPEGGMAALLSRVAQPEAAAGINGQVQVEFVVDRMGRVQNPVVTQSLCATCDAAALAALDETTFTPGKQAGQAVPVKMSLAIPFGKSAGTLTRRSSGDDATLLNLRIEDLTRSGNEISGRVVDATTGKALPGVNIVLKGGTETLGAASDLTGHFRITRATAAYTTVEARFIGAKTASATLPR